MKRSKTEYIAFDLKYWYLNFKSTKLSLFSKGKRCFSLSYLSIKIELKVSLTLSVFMVRIAFSIIISLFLSFICFFSLFYNSCGAKNIFLLFMVIRVSYSSKSSSASNGSVFLDYYVDNFFIDIIKLRALS